MTALLHFFKFHIISIFLCLVAESATAQELLYSWQSPNGTVEETGGTLEHFKQNGHDKRNVPCGDFFTFVLNGNYAYVDSQHNVDECSYMKITLADGNTFKAGDEIEVTAMRNNQADRPASIYFLFRTTQQQPATDPNTGLPIDGEYKEVEIDVPLVDRHVWNNLGQGKDSTIGGSTESKAGAPAKANGSAFKPSTYTFVVPKEADGAKYLRLTRYETGNLLYISSFIVRRSASSAILSPTLSADKTCRTRKYLNGNRIVIERNGKLYNINGAAE